MKSGRAQIGIFQKMRIKNLRGSVRSDFKKLDFVTLETSKNHLIRNFRGRLRWLIYIATQYAIKKKIAPVLTGLLLKHPDIALKLSIQY